MDAPCCGSAAGRTELVSLRKRWFDASGEDMPLSIQDLPIDRVRRAVELTESGQTVFVPPAAVNRSETDSDLSISSLRDWDHESNN